MLPLTSDMRDEEARPYFLWDEDLSIRELRRRLRHGPPAERLRLLGKLLREARDDHVWHFVTPREVAASLSEVERSLGRRRAFWCYLIDGWRDDGLL